VAIIALVTPIQAHAGIFSFVTNLFASETVVSNIPDTNSQKMPLLEAPVNTDVKTGSDPHELIASAQVTSTTIESTGSAQVPNAAKKDGTGITNSIRTYKVKAGDTISGIADDYGISVNTILWANDLKRTSMLKLGQTLVILPITGVEHKVTSGDTLLTIATKYKADMDEMLAFNNLSAGDTIKPGDIIIVPDGEQAIAAAPKIAAKTTTAKSLSANVASAALGVNVANASEGYYMRPITGGTKTQGIHGTNAVDLADACGTPIYASADGSVIVSKDIGAWDGGYGNYVVIDHSNGSQTLYGHMKTVTVNEGDKVQQGQQIGTIGATGKVSGTTGCHVHFEIRNGIRNPF
jgi:murein DD-endopeptidase MepM/ murein hydrolase activator NlpD